DRRGAKAGQPGGLGGRVLGFSREQWRGNSTYDSAVDMMQRHKRPFRVKTSRQHRRIASELLKVDDFQRLSQQGIFLQQLFVYTGAYKANIGISGQHGPDHAVMIPHADNPISPLYIHTCVKQLQSLGLETAKVMHTGGRDTFIRKVAQHVDVIAFLTRQDDTANAAGRLTFPSSQDGSQYAGQASLTANQ